MKYAYAFLVALLVVGTSAFPLSFDDDDYEPNELDLVLLDFFQILSQEEIQKISRDHVQDPELWAVLAYAKSEEFHKLIYAVEDLPEFHKYVLFLQNAGYNVIREIRIAHEVLEMNKYVPPKDVSPEVMANLKKGGGFDGYLDDILAILPKKEIKELHEKKLKESPAFAKFVAAVSSPKFVDVTLALYSQEPMQILVREAKAHGLDIQKIQNLKTQLIGLA